MVGRSPWTAADALVGLSRLAKESSGEERVQGDPRRPGGCPTTRYEAARLAGISSPTAAPCPGTTTIPDSVTVYPRARSSSTS